ncbi:hypothetical protein TELCIR_11567 [Teladorsagia circumcincta]|uniref:GDP-fucose protein O-fucosyltransferase 1 n=1 Tax=Teladorsagia circumcincta TaxID=45464 RepID=A0A2G9UAE1_TELCI|nr:hypothetical protein TELCIR_11567 [Teladorsagia circumcincta]
MLLSAVKRRREIPLVHTGTRFPSSEFPVLAFPSPPAPFPSRPGAWELQRYLKWSSRIMNKATQFISEKLSRPFVGIHLRNDKDWDRVCEHIPTTTARQPLFASMQCEGEDFYDGTITKEICSPSTATVVEQVIDWVGKIGARSVFVSSDKDHMIETLNEALNAYDVGTTFLANDFLDHFGCHVCGVAKALVVESAIVCKE